MDPCTHLLPTLRECLAGCGSDVPTSVVSSLHDAISELEALCDDSTGREEARIEQCRERGVDPYPPF